MYTFSELKQQLTPALTELGLREQEIDLYVHTSLLGPSTVAVLADQLGLSAPNVYKLIARLEEFGLTTFSQQKGYHRKLVIEPPTKIIELLQKKRGTMERLTEGLRFNIGGLLESFQPGDTPPVIRILQGQAQFRRATEQMFDEVGKEILIVGSLDRWVEILSEETYQELAKLRIAKQIKLRALISPTPFAKRLQSRSAQDLREIRFLKPTSLVASMQLSERKAIIWQPRSPLAVLVEDASIVELWRAMFVGLWEKSK